jgi:hypothetical protein
MMFSFSTVTLTILTDTGRQGFFVSLDISKIDDGRGIVGRGVAAKKKDAEKLVRSTNTHRTFLLDCVQTGSLSLKHSTPPTGSLGRAGQASGAGRLPDGRRGARRLRREPKE